MRVCKDCGISAAEAAAQNESVCNRDGLVSAHWFVDLTVYEQIAKVYQETYGEPLVAGWEWVEPIFDTCELAVAVDAGMSYEGFVSGERHAEVIARTAAVIAVTTHGLDAIKTKTEVS